MAESREAESRVARVARVAESSVVETRVVESS